MKIIYYRIKWCLHSKNYKREICAEHNTDEHLLPRVGEYVCFDSQSMSYLVEKITYEFYKNTIEIRLK